MRRVNEFPYPYFITLPSFDKNAYSCSRDANNSLQVSNIGSTNSPLVYVFSGLKSGASYVFRCDAYNTSDSGDDFLQLAGGDGSVFLAAAKAVNGNSSYIVRAACSTDGKLMLKMRCKPGKTFALARPLLELASTYDNRGGGGLRSGPGTPCHSANPSRRAGGAR